MENSKWFCWCRKMLKACGSSVLLQWRFHKRSRTPISSQRTSTWCNLVRRSRITGCTPLASLVQTPWEAFQRTSSTSRESSMWWLTKSRLKSLTQRSAQRLKLKLRMPSQIWSCALSRGRRTRPFWHSTSTTRTSWSTETCGRKKKWINQFCSQPYQPQTNYNFKSLLTTGILLSELTRSWRSTI